MEGETGLVLDVNKPISGQSTQPNCSSLTDDIPASLDHARNLNVEVTSEPQDIGGVIFATFRDPDGNPLMVCQRT